MRLKKGVRNLIIGHDKHNESYVEFKQVMLSGQFALIGALLCTCYVLFDLAVGLYHNIPVLGSAVILLATSIFIHQQGDHVLANYFLLPTMNVTLYLISASESPNSGAFIFFLTNFVAAFAVFSYKKRLISILFTVFTRVLFILAYFVDYSFLSERVYNEETIKKEIVYLAALASEVWENLKFSPDAENITFTL